MGSERLGILFGPVESNTQGGKEAKKIRTCLLMVLLVVLSVQASAAEAPPTFLLKSGSFGIGDGEFIWHTGVAVDNRGNVYVVDIGNSRIQKFDSDGIFLLRWGSIRRGQVHAIRGIDEPGKAPITKEVTQ